MNAFLIAVGPLAIVVQKIVETIRNAFDPTGKAPKYVWNILPFVVGVGTALVVKSNYAALLPSVAINVTGTTGQVLTGLGLGAVAGGWEHLFSLAKASTANKQASAEVSKAVAKK